MHLPVMELVEIAANGIVVLAALAIAEATATLSQVDMVMHCHV